MRIEFGMGSGGQSGSKGLQHGVTQWLVNAVGLALVVRTVQGVTLKADTPGQAVLTVLGSSAVLGLLNLLVKPLLIIVTLPVNILTLGLFTLVINGFVFWAVSALVPALSFTGFGVAVWAALCLSFFTFVINALLQGSFVSVRGRGRR